MNAYDRIHTLDFIIWKGWPANPLNLFALAIQIGTDEASHVSIAHKVNDRVSHFEAIASGFRQNAFNINDRGLLCIRRLNWDALFERAAVETAQIRMLARMYKMCDERNGYGYGNILAAAAKILFRYKTPNRQPILDRDDSTICSEAASRIVRLEGLPGVKAKFENAITGNNLADAWVWPVHFLKSENLITIWQKGES